MTKILIIDDEDKLRGLLARMLELEGYAVVQAAHAKAGLKLLEHEDIGLVISDVKLPDANGVELTRTIKTQYPHLEIIVLTAYGTIADGVKAIQNGAFDYITKGDDNDRILPLVSRTMEKTGLQQKSRSPQHGMGDGQGFAAILGDSAGIREAKTLARKVAATEATVLLLGETGTGKEVFAQAIHQASPRKTAPFVAVNCSALGRDILESELFGYRAGAFTGAMKDKRGLLEEAGGGTVFLDEIGEMGLDLQAKILRALETREFYKVGDTKPTRVDVRFMAATNRDLEKEAAEGRFRLDLYYRLSVFQITLPPLRQRREDIRPLAGAFLAQFAAKPGQPTKRLSDAFVEKLECHPWKGNIRELKNVMERAVILSEHDELAVQDLPLEMQNSMFAKGETSGFDLQALERQHIHKVMRHTKGSKAEAARLLGIGLTTLYRKLDEYGLDA